MQHCYNPTRQLPEQLHNTVWTSEFLASRCEDAEPYLSYREVTTGILIGLQTQLSQGHQTLDAAAEGNKDSIVLCACHVAMRSLSNLKVLHQKGAPQALIFVIARDGSEC